MNSWMTLTRLVLISECDANAMMSYPAIASVFMDLAGVHAEKLGIGSSYCYRNERFWLTVRSRIRFQRRPRLMELVELSTWAEESTGIRCNRDYEIAIDGKRLIEGRTEWSMMDLKSRSLLDMKEVYPKDIVFDRGALFSDGYHDFTEACPEEVKAVYQVSSTDIDFGNHMNNAAYVRMIFSLYSTKELKKMDLSEMEMLYLSSCYEGETLSIYALKKEKETLYFVKKENGKTAFCIRLLER